MSARVRWFRVETKLGLVRLADALSSKPFDENSTEGFRLIHVRKTMLEASFFRKEEYTEERIDPFGRPQNAERTEYRETRFILRSTYPELEIVRASRGLPTLFSRLSEAAQFDLAVNTIEVSVAEWADAIMTALVDPIRFTGATVSRLNYAPEVMGRLIIASKSADIRSSLAASLAGRAHSLDRLQLAISFGGVLEQVTISSDATLRSNRETSVELLEVIRRALA